MGQEVVVVQAPAPCSLAELSERIRPALEAAGAERAASFGSWARGTADGFSDLDLAASARDDLDAARLCAANGRNARACFLAQQAAEKARQPGRTSVICAAAFARSRKAPSQ